jgi:hypothetical protein
LSSSDCDRFLNLYRESLEPDAGRLALFTLPAKRCFASSDPVEIRDAAMTRAAQGQNVYIHIHLHQLPHGEHNRRGRIDTASVAIGLVSDIDAQGPARQKPPEVLCPTVADAIGVAQEFATMIARPAIIINSGFGCYAILLFKEPYEIQTDEERQRLDAIGRRYHEALQRIAAGRGWTGAVDYCDLAKVIRLPGTINAKDPANPMPVRIVGENPSRYNVGDLEELLPEVGGPKLFAISRAPTKPVNGNASPNSAPPKSSGESPLRIERPSAELILAIIKVDPKFADTWRHNRQDFNDQSCSAYDMAWANIGVGCRLGDSLIAGLIDENRRRFPRAKRERKRSDYLKYLARTIAKARASQRDTESDGFDAARPPSETDSAPESVSATGAAAELKLGEQSSASHPDNGSGDAAP